MSELRFSLSYSYLWTFPRPSEAEMDTVGNCSVVDSKPSASSGMKIMGDKGGYASKEDAAKALKGLPKDKCKGIVG
jgi:hypothetical protein